MAPGPARCPLEILAPSKGAGARNRRSRALAPSTISALSDITQHAVLTAAFESTRRRVGATWPRCSAAHMRSAGMILKSSSRAGGDGRPVATQGLTTKFRGVDAENRWCITDCRRETSRNR